MINSGCHAHIWSKKRQFYQNDTILWAKKVNEMPFFPNFSVRNNCSHTHIFLKNFHSLKKRCSHVHNLPTKRSLCQKHCAVMSFLYIFHENPLLLWSYFVKKHQFCKTTLYYVTKKSIGCSLKLTILTFQAQSWFITFSFQSGFQTFC